MPELSPTVLMLSQEVHPVPPLKGAAVEQWIDAVARGMQGYHPLIFSPPHPLRPLNETIGLVRYRRIRVGALYKRLFKKLTRLDPYPYIERVIRAARPTPPAIIHIHNAPGFVPALRAAFPAAQLILHMHNEKQLPPGIEVDCFVGCSAHICRWFQTHVAWGKMPRFEQIRNGVDIASFIPRWQLAQADLRSGRVQYGIPEDKLNILYVGRISHEKGPDLLVEAFRLLPAERFHLTMVGEWPASDAGQNARACFAQELKARMAGLAITVIDGLAPEQMSAIYPLGDLIVIPSRLEAFSMVAIEAMASGVPVLAFRRGGMLEYMRDGENACLLDPEAGPAALALGIEQQTADLDQLDAMAHKARLMVEQDYSWGKVAAETEQLYQSLQQIEAG